MALLDLLCGAHSRYQASFSIVNETLSDKQVFHDLAVAQARSAFADRLNEIFAGDFKAVAKSTGSVSERLLRLISAFDQQRVAYLAAFPSEADQDTAQAESVDALEQSFHDLLA